MAIHHLDLPLSEEQVRSLNVGDSIYVTGQIVTARDDAHKHALKLHSEGKELPVDLGKLGIFHCGPIMRENAESGEWEVVAAGPTTSTRMELFQDEFIEAFGSNLIIGKGGMGTRTSNACKKFGAVYGMFTGGAALLAADQVSSVAEVHWFDLLGMPECLWVLNVKEFGPLMIGIDAHGNNLFTDNAQKTKEAVPAAHAHVAEAVRSLE